MDNKNKNPNVKTNVFGEVRDVKPVEKLNYDDLTHEQKEIIKRQLIEKRKHDIEQAKLKKYEKDRNVIVNTGKTVTFDVDREKEQYKSIIEQKKKDEDQKRQNEKNNLHYNIMIILVVILIILMIIPSVLSCTICSLLLGVGNKEEGACIATCVDTFLGDFIKSISDAFGEMFTDFNTIFVDFVNSMVQDIIGAAGTIITFDTEVNPVGNNTLSLTTQTSKKGGSNGKDLVSVMEKDMSEFTTKALNDITKSLEKGFTSVNPDTIMIDDIPYSEYITYDENIRAEINARHMKKVNAKISASSNSSQEKCRGDFSANDNKTPFYAYATCRMEKWVDSSIKDIENVFKI